MGIFSLMKNQAGNMKRAMDAENMRFMALHGQVWDPKKDGDGAAGAGGLGSIEDMMKQMDAGESAGGLPMVRPGDASEYAQETLLRWYNGIGQVWTVPALPRLICRYCRYLRHLLTEISICVKLISVSIYLCLCLWVCL